MGAKTLKIPATDGVPLGATRYEPSGIPAIGRCVLIAGATGVRRTFYDRFAAFLAERGFTVLTLDYRGIGDSRPKSLRGFPATMRDWGERDLAAAVDWLAARYPKHALMIVGHSAGGQLVGLLPNNSRAAGMLAVAAQSGYWRLWDVPRRYLNAFLWYVVMPGATAVAGYFPSKLLGLGQDLPAGVARQWARWCRNPDYMVDEDGRPLRPFFDAFRAPILGLSFADDHAFAPREAVAELLGFYTSAPLTHRHIAPADVGQRRIGHWGFFREPGRAALWEESAAWLANPSRPAAFTPSSPANSGRVV